MKVHVLQIKVWSEKYDANSIFVNQTVWNKKGECAITFLELFISVTVRVDMVATNHDKVLTLWRHMPLGQFRANIFWYDLLPLTSGPQKFSKIRVLKVNYFHLLSKKNTSNWNHGLILMLLLFFINKIKDLRQIS